MDQQKTNREEHGWRDIKLSKWRKAKCGREICANDLDMILVEYRGGKGGNVSVDQAYDAYMKDWSPTAEGDTDRDRKKRRSHLSKCLKKMKATFRPKSDQRKYVFQRDQFLQVVVDRVPADDFKWKRREKIDHRRLSDFVSMKVGDAFYKGREGWFAMTSRNTSIDNSRALKADGKVDWVLNEHTYKKLLDIAVKYELLEVFQDYQQPVRDPRGKKLADGMARMIGPGKALPQVRDEWLPLYNAYKGGQTVKLKVVA